MKKVLVIITTAFVSYGGLTMVAMNYYRAIDKSKIIIDFASSNKISEELREELRQNNSSYYQLPSRKKPFKYVKVLKKIVVGYDVVHVNGNSATMALDLRAPYKCKCPVRIAHCHNTKTSHPIINKILKPIFSKMYTNAVACSQSAGKWLFGPDNFLVLPNAINLSKFNYSEIVRNKVRQELNVVDKLVIGTVGAMNKQKNYEKLFNVFKQIKENRSSSHLLCVTGTSVIPEGLQKIIDKLNFGDSITILHKRPDVNCLLQAMDVFVFPSKWEGFGIALLEAQTAGLPCIASDRVPYETNVTDNVRYLSLELSDEQWAEVILNEYDKNIPRSQSFNKIVLSDFNIEVAEKKLMEIYFAN